MNAAMKADQVVEVLKAVAEPTRLRIVLLLADSEFSVKDLTRVLGQHAFELSADNGHQVWIPPGFAHGFYVLSEWADVDYKLTQEHDPSTQRWLRWNDPQIGVEWPVSDAPPLLSPRDAAAPGLDEAELP